MNSYEKENLEFERINRKLDALFSIVNGIQNKLNDQEYDEKLKELEAKAKCAEGDVQYHRDCRRYIEENRQWDRKSWENIDEHYYRMKGENEKCKYPAGIPLEVADVEAPEVL